MSIPNTTSNNNIPCGNIFLGNFVKHLACAVHTSTISIHVKSAAGSPEKRQISDMGISICMSNSGLVSISDSIQYTFIYSLSHLGLNNSINITLGFKYNLMCPISNTLWVRQTPWKKSYQHLQNLAIFISLFCFQIYLNPTLFKRVCWCWWLLDDSSFPICYQKTFQNYCMFWSCSFFFTLCLKILWARIQI